ncbi:hypothetical protein [Actinomadura alba]|uniref:hypothetical protein n=1 Tax=Actinomadura alba TaxID=406431 RepID=UPI00164FE025|nr:hypothetical protein [Actinomadura alba]
MVYVPARSQGNLDIGIQQSIWGWRSETVDRGGTKQVLESLRAGDYLMLGHQGPNPRVLPGRWADASLEKLVVARLSGAVYQDTAPVWPDDVYPHRVRLDILEIQENVKGHMLGPGAMEALRLSANKQGAPVLQQALDAVDLLIDSTAGEAADSDTLDDPADRYLDIDGALDQRARTFIRREQQRLRAKKFGKAKRLQCALCRRILPSQVIHTAHIKRRRDCSFDERRDLANIMAACVLGCDVLFEYGYLYVGDDGTIHASAAAESEPGLEEAVARTLRQDCTEFNEDSRPYFAWHREHVARKAHP